MESKTKILIAVAVLIVIAGGFYWYFLSPKRTMPLPNIAQPTAPASQNDLGTELYEKVTNPITDKLPDTLSPVSNPLEGIYKNPFE